MYKSVEMEKKDFPQEWYWSVFFCYIYTSSCEKSHQLSNNSYDAMNN